MNFKHIFFTAILALAVFSCKENAKQSEAASTPAETKTEVKIANAVYNVDTAASVIEWKGFKPTGSHNGTLQLSSGTINAAAGKIESGNFVINMQSITVLDIPADNEGNGKLKGHLEAEDFFNVAQHPTATFKITGVTSAEGKTTVSGDLTIKGTTHAIAFPASISEDAGTLTLKSDTFKIDRTKWDIKYGSKSFFDNLGDKFINDDIELKVSVTAKK